MVGKEEERMQESKENKKAEGKRQLLAALREREYGRRVRRGRGRVN